MCRWMSPPRLPQGLSCTSQWLDSAAALTLSTGLVPIPDTQISVSGTPIVQNYDSPHAQDSKNTKMSANKIMTNGNYQR